MRTTKRLAAASILTCAALALPAAAFLIQTSEGGGRFVQVSWSTDVLPFWIDAAGSDDVGGEEAARILRESFAEWEAVPSARLRFQDRGVSSGRAPAGRDGRNLLIFDETGDWLGAPSGSGIIAVTRLSTNSFNGRILDADIIFNGRDYRFAAEPTSNRILLRDVAVHEIGHFIGLDHTPLTGDAENRPTMNPFYFGDGPGEAATLEADDVAGVSVMFPTSAFLAEAGTLSGRVTTPAGEGVFGAVVTAEDLLTHAVYSTLSGAETGDADRGAYTIRGLPPGTYRVGIAPLQGGIDESNFGGVFTDFDVDFPTEYFDNVERSELAHPIEIAFPGLHVTDLDFRAGFLIPGQPLVRVVENLGNTPDTLGPYTPRFRIEGAERAELVVDVSGASFIVPLRAVGDEEYEATIPGQAIESRVRYRVRATSAVGLTTEYPSGDQWLQFDVIRLSGLPLVFAVLRDDGALGVFDTGIVGEVARVDLGDDPVQVLTSRDGRFLYVSNLGSNEITVVETATFRVVDRISVAAQPLDMALSVDGRTLYVSNSGAASVTAIDVNSRTIVGRISVGLQTDGPYGIVAGAGDRVYVTDLNDDVVLAVSGDEVVRRIPVATGPRSLALSTDRQEIYVTSFGSDLLTIIDAVEDVVIATLTLPVSGSFAVALHPHGVRLFVTGHDDGVVVVLDLGSREVIDVVPVGANPRGLTFSPAGDRLFVTTAASNEIYVLDADSHELLGTFRAGGEPRGISVINAPAPPQRTTIVDAAAEPAAWTLSEVYPNPFNPAASIIVTVPAAGVFRVEVYDALGQRVRRLAVSAVGAGRHTLSWDGRDDVGRAVSSGVYLFVVNTPAGRLVRKGMLLR